MQAIVFARQSPDQEKHLPNSNVSPIMMSTAGYQNSPNGSQHHSGRYLTALTCKALSGFVTVFVKRYVPWTIMVTWQREPNKVWYSALFA